MGALLGVSLLPTFPGTEQAGATRPSPAQNTFPEGRRALCMLWAFSRPAGAWEVVSSISFNLTISFEFKLNPGGLSAGTAEGLVGARPRPTAEQRGGRDCPRSGSPGCASVRCDVKAAALELLPGRGAASAARLCQGGAGMEPLLGFVLVNEVVPTNDNNLMALRALHSACCSRPISFVSGRKLDSSNDIINSPKARREQKIGRHFPWFQ